MKTNVKNCGIDFERNRNPFLPIKINGKPLQVVEESKLLGLTIASNLKWNSHMNNIVSKSLKRICAAETNKSPD